MRGKERARYDKIVEMNKSVLFRFSTRVLVASLFVFLTSTVVWLFGRHSAERFGHILFVVGVIAAIIGSLLGHGARQGSSDPDYFSSRSVSNADLDERIRQDREYQEQSEGTGMVLAVAGGIGIATACMLFWLL